ncbi:O-antigen ligase [Fluviicola sp.]|uniref:O-antigen ligase family protein n=1 Tax=Fluviicola sp. TaxID=1917219 RepID=UPI002633CF27|nr:O-antigen ligase family protein [Fluviicola sp.]
MDDRRSVKMKINLQKINYFYIAFVILWLPINLAFLNIDGKGRIPAIITTLVLILNTLHDNQFYKKHFLARPFYLWLIWIIYNGINLLIKGFNHETSLGLYIITTLFIPYLSMIISYKEIQRDKTKFLNFTVVILVIFSLLSVTVLGKGELTDSDANLEVQRVSGKLGNIGPLISLFILFFLSLLYIIKKKRLETLIIFTIYIIGVVALSGTRKAIGAVMLILLASYLAKIKFTFKNILATIFISLVLSFGYNYVMENTALGVRFEKGIADGQKANTSNIEALNFLGDRAFFYIDGWMIFTENPLSGIGLENYTSVSKNNYRLHTEYIVQLTETGLIGTSLFFLFNFSIGKRLISTWKKYKNRRSEVWGLSGGFLAILFLGLTAWTYSFPHYFIVFGVIIGFLETIRREEERNEILY